MPAKKKVTLKTRTPSGRALGIVKRTAKPSRLDAQRYHESFFALTEGVVMVSDAGRVIAANPKAKAILGMTAKKMEQALRNDSAWRAIKADDTPFPAANFPIRKCLRTGKPQKNVLIGIRPGGKALRWLLVNTQPLFSGSKSKPVAIVASFEKATQRHCAEVKNARRATASNTTPNAITSTGHNDVSLNKEALQRTRSNEELFRLALNCIPDALLIYDHDFRLQFVNQRGAEFFASNSADIVGKRDEDLLPLDVTRSYLPVLQQARASKVLQSVELTFSLRGRQISIAATYVPMLDESGKVWQILGMLRDITNRRQTEERLSFMAQYDSLTGLPNRYLLLDRLEAAMQRAKRNNTLLGVMILDIDRFKHINDSRGHATGDILLQQVAARLACSLRATDTIARIGGDEFTVLVENATSVEEISSIAEKVKNAFSTPFETESGEVFTTTSVGITIYPHDDHNRDELLKNADLAMYHAKQQRNAWQLYSPDMNSNSANRLGMEVELRQALERDEFELHFLPQLQVRTGALVGMEALIRWNNKALGRVSPGDFIPLAEDTGLIVPIGEWILRAVCKQCKAWELAGISPFTVSVNISAPQFRRSNLLDLVRSVLSDCGLDPRWLGLEITESSIMKHAEQTIKTLVELREMGVAVAIDDFGTGYSNLSYLKRFPVNKIKVDQSFVRDIIDDPNHAAIVAAVVAMSKELGIKTVAEGVETRAQLDFLARMDCDEYQGYYFSKPIPAADVAPLILAHKPIHSGGVVPLRQSV